MRKINVRKALQKINLLDTKIDLAIDGREASIAGSDEEKACENSIVTLRVQQESIRNVLRRAQQRARK